MRGASLIEMAMATALAGLLATAGVAALRPLSSAASLEAARLTLIDALIEARRRAYETEAAASVFVSVGSGSLRVEPDGGSRSLGAGVSITSAPADSSIQFRASGLADNATVRLAAGGAAAVVVVNQRGMIR